MTTTQKAIIVASPAQAGIVTDRPIPKLRDDYILVKVKAVALNPTDWVHVKSIAEVGNQIGCDYAGIVEAVGKNVKKVFKKGDRIAGFAHGGNTVQPEDGAFAEYIVVKGDVQMHIPDNLTFEQAATLGVGISTVGQALYQSLKLAWPTSPLPETEKVPILIYGGSSATGALAIQYAKLSGYEVLTTSSPRNFDLVKSFGADKVWDYNDPNAAAEIHEYTNNKLHLVFDTIATPFSANFNDKALSTDGGDYGTLLQIKNERANVTSRYTLGYTIFGEDFQFRGKVLPASAEDKEFAEKWWALAEKLLAEGKIKTHRMKVHDTGLEGALEGMKLMEQGKVSGEKLVYIL